MTWYTIETLTAVPDTDISEFLRHGHATVVAKDGIVKEWTSLNSIERETGISVPAAYDTAKNTHGDVVRCPGRRGERAVAIDPVTGVDESVYALRLWIGTPDTEIAARRNAAAVTFDNDTLLVQMTEDLYMMSSLTLDDYSPLRSPDKFWHKVFDTSDMDKLVGMALNPAVESAYLGRIWLVHDDGHLMTWSAHGRAAVGANRNECRAIVHDVTDAEPPNVGLADVYKIAQPEVAAQPQHQAILTVNRPIPPIVTHWLTARPSWLGYSHDSPVPSVFHDDEWPKIHDIAEQLKGASPRSQLWIDNCHVWSANQTWTSARVGISRYPGLAPGHLLHLLTVERNTV